MEKSIKQRINRALIQTGIRIRRFRLQKYGVNIILGKRPQFSIDDAPHITHQVFDTCAHLFYYKFNAFSITCLDRDFESENLGNHKLCRLARSPFEFDQIRRRDTVVCHDRQNCIVKCALLTMLFVDLRSQYLTSWTNFDISGRSSMIISNSSKWFRLSVAKKLC